LYFGDADHTGGVVNNSGTITSDSRAVNIDGTGLTLDNSGDILATGSQRNGTVYVDGTGDNFAIQNSGSIDARGGSGSAVSVQVGSFAGDVQNGAITNGGTIIGSGASDLDAGIRFFDGAGSNTFAGDIVNTVGGFIGTEGDAAAVLFDQDVSFDGNLKNNGQIDGSIFLNDGNLVLGNTSELFLEISSLNDFETIETSGALLADGILNIEFDEFLPSVGQTFDLFDFGFVSGAFDLVQADNVVFDTTDLFIGGSVTIQSVGAAAVAVPEPASITALALAGLAFAGRRRRNG